MLYHTDTILSFKMAVFSRFCLLWLLIGKIHEGRSELSTFYEASELDMSSIPVDQRIIIEEDRSILSCGMQCAQDESCIGFGFKEKPQTKCLPVRNGFVQAQQDETLDGYTYYSKSNTSMTLFYVLHIIPHAFEPLEDWV